MNSGLGKKIDEDDVVIRLNRGVELIKEYSRDIGERTDVLYSCLIEKPANAGKLNINLFDDLGIKMICAPPHSDFKGISHHTQYHELVDLHKIKRISEEIPIRIVEHDFHTDLALEVSCKPNTGFLAIYDLLRFNPKKLSIYGFSFYLDGFIAGCKEGIEGEQGLTEEQFALKCFNSKRHNQKNMWSYCKKTLLNNERVKLDSFLYKILNLKEFSKEEFSTSIK
jgi:hypothetical protein